MYLSLNVIKRGPATFGSPSTMGLDTRNFFLAYEEGGNAIIQLDNQDLVELNITLAALTALVTDGSMHTATVKNIGTSGVSELNPKSFLLNTGRVMSAWSENGAGTDDVTLSYKFRNNPIEISLQETYSDYISRFNSLRFEDNLLNSLEVFPKSVPDSTAVTSMVAINGAYLGGVTYDATLDQTTFTYSPVGAQPIEYKTQGNFVEGTPGIQLLLSGITAGAPLAVATAGSTGIPFVSVDHTDVDTSTVTPTGIVAYANPVNVAGIVGKNGDTVVLKGYDDAVGTTLLGSITRIIPGPGITYSMPELPADNFTFVFSNTISDPSASTVDLEVKLTVTGGASAGVYNLPAFQAGGSPDLTGLPAALQTAISATPNTLVTSSDNLDTAGVTKLEVDLVVRNNYVDSTSITSIVRVFEDFYTMAYDNVALCFTGPDGIKYPDYTYAGFAGLGETIPDIAGWAQETVAGFTNADVATAIANANAAGVPTRVYFPNGTYNLTASHTITASEVVLEGESESGVIVNFNSGVASPGCFVFENSSEGFEEKWVNVDVNIGDTTLELAGGVGAFTTANLPTRKYINFYDAEPPASLANKYRINGATPDGLGTVWYRDMNVITASDDVDTITLAKPMRVPILAAASAGDAKIRSINFRDYVGIEKMTIVDTYNSGFDLVHFKQCVLGWMRNVTLRDTGRHPIGFEKSQNLEFRDCTFDGAQNAALGSNGYGGAIYCFDSLYVNCTWIDMRHAINFQDWSLGNVINGCTCTNSDGQYHEKFPRWNLITDTEIIDDVNYEETAFRSARLENNISSHQPAGEFNTIFNCDVQRQDVRGGGLFMGGLMDDFVFAYNRLYAACVDEGLPGPVTVINRYLVRILDFMNDMIMIGNVLATDDPGDYAWGFGFYPGFYEYPDANYGQSGKNLVDALSPPYPGCTLSGNNAAIANTSTVDMIKNTWFGVDPARRVYADVSETFRTDDRNVWDDTTVVNPASLPARPSPFTTSLYDWQLTVKPLL